MSKVLDAKKRKAAPESRVASKKTKIDSDVGVTSQAKSATKKAASRTIVSSTPDSLSVRETKPSEKPSGSVKAKKSEGVESTTSDATTTEPRRSERTSKKSVEDKDGERSTKTKKEVRKPTRQSGKSEPTENTFAGFSDDEEEGGAKISDQTAALLAGFDSSEDENEPADTGMKLDKIPAMPDSAELKKQLVAAQTGDDDDTPGVLYIGRIPHGFYEPQMKAYFSQFGDITRLRLARNKLSGHSKHYAFIEFSSAAVADVVAKTMDKYLMFGHILQVRRIPAEQVHPELWKGANKRFKPMPRNKIEGGILRRGATRDRWEDRIKTETKRRSKKAKKLSEMDYEFDMPTLKSVADVPVKERVVIATDEAEAPTAEPEPEVAPALPETAQETPEAAVAATAEETPESTETAALKRKKGSKAPKQAKKVRLST